MDRPARLTDLQVDLAIISFSLDAARGYLIPGGAALLACELIDPLTARGARWASARLPAP